jgi:hypothetical protein
MATFAVIKDGVVENCIVADSLAFAEEVTGATCVEYFLVAPGWTYANGKFIEPEVTTVEEVVAEETPAVVEEAPAE